MSVFPSGQSEGDEWISVSDLMSGLMLVFLAIAVFFMIQIQNDKGDLENIAVLYEELQTGLYEQLQEEFSQDLAHWNAEIDSTTLSMRFLEREILFEPGRAELNEQFTAILADFFPRYVGVLTSDEYRDHITGVRIEGHTSSDWIDLVGLEAYEANMRLSQERTRTVLSYVVRLPGVEDVWDSWLRERLTANGLSSSKLVLVGDVEDPDRSRRVEFRVRTDAEEQMEAILGRIKSGDTVVGAGLP
jgi:outer membrane protein OmpA-like peptidoglycan-associated protein